MKLLSARGLLLVASACKILWASILVLGHAYVTYVKLYTIPTIRERRDLLNERVQVILKEIQKINDLRENYLFDDPKLEAKLDEVERSWVEEIYEIGDEFLEDNVFLQRVVEIVEGLNEVSIFTIIQDLIVPLVIIICALKNISNAALVLHLVNGFLEYKYHIVHIHEGVDGIEEHYLKLDLKERNLLSGMLDIVVGLLFLTPRRYLRMLSRIPRNVLLATLWKPKSKRGKEDVWQDIQDHFECCICFEDFKGGDVYSCENDHWICRGCKKFLNNQLPDLQVILRRQTQGLRRYEGF